MTDNITYRVTERWGVKSIKAEPADKYCYMAEPIPLTRWQRIDIWVSGVVWDILTSLAPTLPIIGAVAGYALMDWWLP